MDKIQMKYGCFLVPAMFLHVCDITKEEVKVFLAQEQILGLKRVGVFFLFLGKPVSIPQSLR